MKKSIISTLCSALVIPGLGQILNEDLKKGALILIAVFALFIGGLVNLYGLVRALANKPAVHSKDPSAIFAHLKAEDMTFLWILLSAFLLLWIYSVVDAFFCGRRLDRSDGGNDI